MVFENGLELNFINFWNNISAWLKTKNVFLTHLEHSIRINFNASRFDQTSVWSLQFLKV